MTDFEKVIAIMNYILWYCIFLKLEHGAQLSTYIGKSIAPKWLVEIPTDQNMEVTQDGHNNWHLLIHLVSLSLQMTWKFCFF